MNDLLQQLLSMGPAIGAGVSGNGNAMQAFMDGYQKTMAQLQQQARLKQTDQLAAEDRQRLIERQTLADQNAAQDRARAGEVGKQQDFIRSQQAAGELTQTAANFDDPSQAKSYIESMMPNLMSVFGQGAMALGQPAVEQATRVITGRQKKQVSDFVSAAMKVDHIVNNPDADPEIQLPEHIAKILGKPSARLSEVQTFAQLPVGKPQGKERMPAAAGSFEDYVQRKYGDAPTPEQIIEARKLYSDAGREPEKMGGPGNGLNPYQSAQLTERLAKDWMTSTSSSREMKRQFSVMETGLNRFRQGDKNGGSQAVLVTFQKILDPTSVVRESEYARSAAGISFLQRLQGYADRLQAGGAGVPEKELRGMVETARQMVADMDGYNAAQRSRIGAMATKYQIDPVLVFGAEPPAQAAPPPPPAEPMTPATSHAPTGAKPPARPRTSPRGKNPFRP